MIPHALRTALWAALAGLALGLPPAAQALAADDVPVIADDQVLVNGSLSLP